MVCKFCKKKDKLVRSHIIPRSFCSFWLSERGAARAYKYGQKYPSKYFIGIYDDHLACEECERLFSPYDDYAYDFLVKSKAEWKPYSKPNGVDGLVAECVDYKKLKLFMLALLWRMSATTRPEYNVIDLKQYEEDFISKIKNGDPGEKNYFSTAFAINGEIDSGEIYNPIIDLNFTSPIIRITIPGYLILVCVGNQGFPVDIGIELLQEGQPLMMRFYDIHRGIEGVHRARLYNEFFAEKP